VLLELEMVVDFCMGFICLERMPTPAASAEATAGSIPPWRGGAPAEGAIATGVPAAVSIRSRRQFAGRRKHTLTLKRVRTHTGAKRSDFSHEN